MQLGPQGFVWKLNQNDTNPSVSDTKIKHRNREALCGESSFVYSDILIQ